VQQQPRRQRHREQRERDRCVAGASRPLALENRPKRCKVFVQAVPCAPLHSAVDKHGSRIAMVGIERQDALECGFRRVELALLEAERADVDVDLGDVRGKPGRFAQALLPAEQVSGSSTTTTRSPSPSTGRSPAQTSPS